MSSGIFSGRKLYFRFLMFQNGSKNQYLGFQRISRKSEKVEFLTYHVTRPLIELKVVVSECHVIPSPVNLIGCPVKCVGTANLVVKLSVTPKISHFQNMLGFIQYGSRLFVSKHARIHSIWVAFVRY